MALVRDIYGWEVGANYGIINSGDTVANMWIVDGTAATGCYYGRCPQPVSAFTLQGTGINLVAGTTDTLKGTIRVKVRIVTNVDVTEGVVGIGASAGTASKGIVQINATRNWRVRLRGGTPSAFSVTPIPLNTFTQVEMTLTVAQVFDGVNTTVTENVTATVAGETLTSGPLVTGAFVGSGIDRMELGLLQNATWGFAAVGRVEFDDLVALWGNNPDTAAVVLPTGTAIRLIAVLAQGVSAAWTGSFTLVQEIPLDTVGAGQTSSVAGQVTTFTHSTFAQFGFGAINVFKVYGDAKATVAGPTTQQIRLNGVDYPVSITNGYQAGVNTPRAVDWTTYPAATFDAAEFGFVNSTGASLTLGAIHGEVLYTPSGSNWVGCNAPSGVDPNAPSPGACVSDMGNGTDSGGGTGCSAGMGSGADSGGGAGCQVTL